jgi:hypothetical protein
VNTTLPPPFIATLPPPHHPTKVINKAMIREPKHRKRLQVERVLLTCLPKSPFIASLTHAFQTDSELFFLMDYCAGWS